MLNAKITGLSHYLPEDLLTNDDLAKMVDTNDEWITTRVGIKVRHVLKKDAGSSYLGIKCVKRLLEETNTNPDDVDLLICPTSNPDYRFPSTASIIAHHLGMEKKCYAYDIQGACCGFLIGIYDAAAYVKAGIYKKVIVCCPEKMTSMVDYEDRATCTLFGDAAGAVLIEPTEEEGMGIIDGVFHVNGEGIKHLVYKAGGSARPATHATVDAREHFLYQEGRAVYKHAVIDMLTSSREVMARNGLTHGDIQWFIPHQANLRIIEAVGDRLGIDKDKVLINIQDHGNTSAATIPVCMSESRDKFKKGDKIILTAFGAGFTWGAVYLVWGM